MYKQQAKGYLLELVLSKLIEVNGYEIITEDTMPHESETPPESREIKYQGNGLNVRGRGGYHQFDSLGTFKITPPFIYPLRLFVEAKFYSREKVGINIVRMGVGILEDINTNYSTVGLAGEQLAVTRYHYNYSIFSTTGFTEDAQRYAIAHKIQLIDLSGVEYNPIIKLIDSLVESIPVALSENNREYLDIKFDKFKESFRKVLFEDNSYAVGNLSEQYGREVVVKVENLKNVINGKFLYLASTNSAHIIPLLVTEDFNELLRHNPHQKIAIKWNRSQPNIWIIVPEGNTDIRITFKLPKLLDKYMRKEGRLEHNSRNIKENIIKKMAFIAYLDIERPTLCTLTYDQILTDEIILEEVND